jgi:alcohol dehydrogenase YqhD (iron-dependent ADH family)
MEKVTIHNPTILHFGKNVLDDLPKILPRYGKKVLLVYGKGSVKQTGLYDRMRGILENAGMQYVEFSGIRPNPIIQDVDSAAELGRQNNADFILAVGGGSVIDSAKIIAITIPVDHPAWDFYTGKAKPKKALPVLAVLTLAATGTEMNPFAVLSNPDTGIKDGYRCDLAYPAHSFLDPQLTFTVPRDYTAYGIADLIAHCFEAWFGIGDATLSDRFILSILKEAMDYGPALLEDLQNYTLREKIMYAATMALNGLTIYGKKNGDWGVHGIGHCLSLLYDIPHGASLTIVYPAWLKFARDRIPERITFLGSMLFEENLTADDSISRIEHLFRSLGCPVRLSEMGIPVSERERIIESMIVNKASGTNVKLEEEDYPGIVDMFL